MKIKHWAGYGYVEGTCIINSNAITVIAIKGNHERGLLPRYYSNDDWGNWPGKRFKVGKFIKVDAAEHWDSEGNTSRAEVTFWKET